MSDSNRATVEVVKARKLEKQAGVLLPGSGDSVVYSNARRKLSVVETCNGAPGTTTSLRVEVLTDEVVTTANRPNYRIAVDIPLDETLVNILATALDRAEENAPRFDPDSIPTPRDVGFGDLIEEDLEVETDVGFQDPTVEAVLRDADEKAERAQVEGLEEAAFGAEIRPANDHADVVDGERTKVDGVDTV